MQQPDSTPEHPAPRSLRGRFATRFKILTVLLLIASLLAAAAPLHWFLELFTHFTPHYTFIALLLALALAMLLTWRWAALACALIVWNGYPVARLLFDTPPASTADKPNQFTVFHFNANLDNADPRRIASYVTRNAKNIDVVVLLEATSNFEVALDIIKEDYPHQVRHLQDSPFGIAIASKYPLESGTISREPLQFYPHIEATLKLPGRAAPLAFYAVHAPPPINGELARDRNNKLTYIAQKVAAQGAMTPLVVGDFNLTPWSPYFRQFIANSGLRDARTPLRFDHTWPVTFDNANIGLAVDHSFAHPALLLVKRAIGPDLGSDHMPVTVTFGY